MIIIYNDYIEFKNDFKETFKLSRSQISALEYLCELAIDCGKELAKTKNINETVKNYLKKIKN